MASVGKELDYTAVVGQVMSMEAGLLSREQLTKVAGAKDIDSALHMLLETAYGNTTEELLNIKPLYSYHVFKHIYSTLDDIIITLKSQIPDENILKMQLIEMEAHNLKLLVKYKFAYEGYLESKFSSFRELDFDNVSKSAYDFRSLELNIERMQSLVKHPLSDLHRFIKNDVLSNMIHSVAKSLLKMEKERSVSSSESLLDNIIDSEVIHLEHEMIHNLDSAFPEDKQFMEGYLARKIDIMNIGTVLRKDSRSGEWDPSKLIIDGGNIKKEIMKELAAMERARFIEGVKAHEPAYGKHLDQWLENGGSLEGFDAVGRKILNEYINSAMFVFSPARVYGFLQKKDTEARAVSGILTAKLFGLEGDSIIKVMGLD